MTAVETCSKLVNDNDKQFWAMLNESQTKAVLLPLESTTKNAAGEYLPKEEWVSEQNAPVVVIVTRATPGAAENVSALLARYRGDDPKAEPVAPDAPRKHWFW
jgi:hypothetical protein